MNTTDKIFILLGLSQITNFFLCYKYYYSRDIKIKEALEIRLEQEIKARMSDQKSYTVMLDMIRNEKT